MKYFVLPLLLFPSLVTAQYQDAISTKDVQDCMDSECKVRPRPHPCYQESLKRLKLEQAHVLNKAPRAWLTYRDAQRSRLQNVCRCHRRSSRPH